jgi:peptidoglycan/xylan/chitin deacetylase (PgdA/CDA1 family)
VLSLLQFTEWLKGSPLPSRPAALLTFDHCFADQLESVLPVLDSLKFPATFFPLSAGLAQKHPAVAAHWRNMLLALTKAGHTIGCHTQNHPVLTRLSTTEVRQELHGSKLALEDALGQRVGAFCYPYGAYNARVREVVHEAGFDVAFTVDLGGVKCADDPYQLKRVPVLGEPSAAEFGVYLDGRFLVSGSLLLNWKIRERVLDRPLVALRSQSPEISPTQSNTDATAVEDVLAAYSRTSSLNRARFVRLKRVLQEFDQHGIDCILLKGADLIHRLYGALGLRPMVDVDLLVRERDLQGIDAVLRAQGYYLEIDGNPAYRSSDGILALDLITAIWYLDDQDPIWCRAGTTNLDGFAAKGMGTNDLVIYLTAYTVIHRARLSASFAQDLALLIEKEPLDWDFVVKEASRCHLKIPMYHGLSFVVTRYAGARIPDHVLRSLAPSTLRGKCWHWFLKKLVTEKPVADLGHLLLFLTQPGLKKWRWLRDAFFPSQSFLHYRYGDRWKTHPLWTRLSRPFSLLFRAIRLFTRLVRLQITGRI